MHMKQRLIFTKAVMAFAVTASIVSNCYANDDVVTRGRLNAINSSSATVATTTCALNDSTKYKDENDNSIARTDLTVGDTVKMRCRDSVAREIEIENESSSSSSSSNSSNSSSSSSSSSRGDDDKGSDKSFKGSCDSVDGVTSEGTGTLKFQSSTEDGVRESRFSASIKIPVPSTTPAVTTIEQASALSLKITLLRANVAYAQCSFVFNRVRSEKGSPAAEYMVNVQKEGRKLRLRKGTCDIDLATDGIQAGVPIARKGDTAIVEDSVAGVFLEATLRRS